MKRFFSILTIPCVLFFVAALALSDSYTSGGGASTLQKTLEKENTGALTTDNTMELTATSTYNALYLNHGLGSGRVLEIDNSGSGNGIYVNNAGAGDAIVASANGVGSSFYTYRDNAGAGFYVTHTGSGYGMMINSSATKNPLYVESSVASGNYAQAPILIRSTGNVPSFYIDHSNALGNIMHANTYISGNSPDAFFIGNKGNVSAGISGTTGVVLDTTNIFYGLTDVSTGGMKLTNTHNDALGINLIFDRAPADGGASSDVLSNIVSYGLDASGTSDVMAKITATMMDNASGTEDAKICFSAMVGGTLTEIDCIGNSAVDGSPTKYMGFATGSNTIEVATGTAPGGIIVSFGAHLAVVPNAAYCARCEPLAVNGVELSASCTADERYEAVLGASLIGNSVDASITQTAVYAPADGWNPNITNTISIGSGNITGSCTSTTGDRYNLTVTAIK